MIIEHRSDTNTWILRTDNRVLYTGRRSPWEARDVLLDALERERQWQTERNAGPGPGNDRRVSAAGGDTLQ